MINCAGVITDPPIDARRGGSYKRLVTELEAFSGTSAASNGPTPGPTVGVCPIGTVSSIQEQVNGVPSIDHVIDWVKAQVKKGDMSEASGSVRISSLRQMAEQVAPDEPGDAQAVASNVERLRERFARKNPAGASVTAKTYASRAHATIEEYFRWAAAPDKYDPKRPATRTKTDDPAKKAPPAAIQAPPVATIPQAHPANVPTMGELRSCPLGQGREPFRYILPADGLQVRDAMRIAFHLITTCDDYDPTVSPMQVVSTALQRTP